MMTSRDNPKIVDFAAFRAARQQPRLPLFEDRLDSAPRGPMPGGPVQPLSARQIDHRACMLHHLGRVL